MLNPNAPNFGNTPVSGDRPEFHYRLADPEQAPAVSIVTPFYNAGDHFAETAESVLRQSFQQWEWIVVDDGSTDAASLELLQSYGDRDPRIRVVRQENAGPSAARNRGYEVARSEFIAQIDADDLLETTAIEKWYWFLQSYPEYSFVKGFAVGFQAEEYLWERGFHTPQEFFTANPAQPNSMVRRSVHREAGGYDEDNRAGFEDWDFWFRCARIGAWGGTIPEYLDWYRRRESHNDRWSNWDGARRQKEFLSGLKAKFPDVWKNGIPKILSPGPGPFPKVRDGIPCDNRLEREARRLLLIIPWMSMGGSDRFTLDLVAELVGRGWEVSIVTTLHGHTEWYHEFARYTPDIFVLENFLRREDYPRFVRYLLRSRQATDVLVTHSLLGYFLLPYLRAGDPDVNYLDYCHIEEREWLNGGYPRFGVGNQASLDLNICSSEHLRSWMVDRGGDPARIEVCYTSIDTERWQPDPEARASVREEHRIPADRPVLLYPARLCDQKQPRVFMRTLAALAREGLEFTALVAGDGPERGWMGKFAGQNGLQDRVRFLGTVAPDAIPALMAASDILFLPSKWEGIALSVYEAMACAVTVVGAAVGGQRELVQPGCGFLIEDPDPERQPALYAEILGRLLRDPDECRAVGARGRQLVCERFGTRQMGDRMEELFDHAAELRRAEPRMAVGERAGVEAAAVGLEYLRLQDVADQLWQDREERLGMRKTLRGRLFEYAYRQAAKLPPGPRKVLAKIYRAGFKS